MSLPPTTNTRATHNASVGRMTSLSARIEAVQTQISTSKRITGPSDDPIAFARAAALRRAQTTDAATTRAIDTAARRLRSADITLGSVGELVLRARDLGLSGSNATMSPENRAVLALEVRELAASFAGLAEARDADGVPLFGGAAAHGPAYAPDATGVVRWQGQGTAPPLIAGSALVETGVTGPQAFGLTSDPTPERAQGTSDLFATFTGLAAALDEPDPTLRAAALTLRLTEMEAHTTRLADAQASLGVRGARLEAETVRLQTQSLATASDLSRLEDTDMASAIAELQRLLTVLEAAQASFARTASQSLWDQLR